MVLPLAVPIMVGGAMAAGGGVAMNKAGQIQGTGPRKQSYGGSPEELERLRQQSQMGIGQGQALQSQGMNQLGVGTQQAQDIGKYQGGQLYGQGQGMLGQFAGARDRGNVQQLESMGMMREAALGQAPSQAALLGQANADRAMKAQQALAATARGGSQASAMRGAQAMGQSMLLDANQQAMQMRAAEMAQARAQFGAATSDYAQSNIARAQMTGQLGMQQTGMGLQAQQYGANAMIGQGQFTAGMGAQNTGMWLGNQTDINQSQLDASIKYDAMRAANQQSKRDALFGLGGNMLGTGAGMMAGRGG